MANAVLLPKRMAQLPVDGVGRPVPWFVAWIDDKPDFRVIKPNAIRDAVVEKRCWVCGQKFTGLTRAFVIGPMCAVNRVSAEPPSHRECAEYSARACPFLNNPAKVRREANKPEDTEPPAGVMIERNPGVTLVWVTARFTPFNAAGGGVLFHIGDPLHTYWFAHGREATRPEVLESIETGLPILQRMADEEGEAATAQLASMVDDAMRLVPTS